MDFFRIHHSTYLSLLICHQSLPKRRLYLDLAGVWERRRGWGIVDAAVEAASLVRLWPPNSRAVHVQLTRVCSCLLLFFFCVVMLLVSHHGLLVWLMVVLEDGVVFPSVGCLGVYFASGGPYVGGHSCGGCVVSFSLPRCVYMHMCECPPPHACGAAPTLDP